MNMDEVKKNIEAAYLDFYNKLYTEQQLKTFLLNLHKEYDISSSQWSKLILDAQWKYANEQDYEDKIKQLEQENKDDNEQCFGIFYISK